MIRDSYIVQCVNRTYKTKEKNEQSKYTTNMVEEMGAHELGSEINELAKGISTVRSLIPPEMNNKAYQLQDLKGDIHLKKVHT